MKKDYAEVFQSEAAAAKYDEVVYAEGNLARVVNEREATWLRHLVRERFPEAPPVQHDFACGTGRAIEALQGCVAAAHGYDTSEAMISRARSRGLTAEFHIVDAEGPVPEPAATHQPAIVTVFRLLLNTGPDVRDRAIAFAARVLPDAASGLLVIENHGNSRSLRHLVKARHRNDSWFNELSHREVHELLARHGFRVESIHGFTLLPKGILSRRWARPWAGWVDTWASRRSWLAPYARCLTYVACRVD